MRENQVTAPVVVLAIHPCDGHKVRKLPEEEQGVECATPPKLRFPDAAAQPMSGGIAPGKAPTSRT